MGLFYTVDPNDLKKISPFGKALPLQFREEVKSDLGMFIYSIRLICLV